MATLQENWNLLNIFHLRTTWVCKPINWVFQFLCFYLCHFPKSYYLGICAALEANTDLPLSGPNSSPPQSPHLEILLTLEQIQYFINNWRKDTDEWTKTMPSYNTQSHKCGPYWSCSSAIKRMLVKSFCKVL